MTTEVSTGLPLDEHEGMTLRERKRLAARDSLSLAAIRLAMERGLENVRVEDIANEVGVSPRTFNNYFASKEEAICSVTIRRNARIGDFLLRRPAEEPIWEATTNAVVEHFAELGEPTRTFVERFRLLIGNPALRGEFLKAHGEVERRLCAAVAERTGTDPERDLGPRLLAGAISSAMRVAWYHWMNVDPEASLVETIRAAMSELANGIPTLTAKSGNAVGGARDDLTEREK